MTARSLLLEKLARDCAAEKEVEVLEPDKEAEATKTVKTAKKAVPKKAAPKKKVEIEKVEKVEKVEIEKVVPAPAPAAEPEPENESDSDETDFEPICFHPPSLTASSNFTFAAPFTVNIHIHM